MKFPSEVLIASDHAGYALKERLKSRFPEIKWQDLGPTDSSRVDYPDYADRVAAKVSQTPATRGVLICGSGQGMAIRANRHANVRAALAWNEESIQLAREHNDANVLCLGARLLEPQVAERLIELFLATPFAGGRHQDRVTKIERKTGC